MSEPGTCTWREILEIKTCFMLTQLLLILRKKIKQFEALFSGLIIMSVIWIQWDLFSLSGLSGFRIVASVPHPSPMLRLFVFLNVARKN